MKSKTILFLVAFGMITATMGCLAVIKSSGRLGEPGVRVGPVPLYDSHGKIVADHSVLLPDVVQGISSETVPMSDAELGGLPQDTTFGRRRYFVAQDFTPVVGVVLMGTDRTSIHDPHYCLVGQGWNIDQTERVPLSITEPIAYELPVMKLTASQFIIDGHQHSTLVRGIYVYWFVSRDKVTADQGTRLWSIAKTMVEKRELERWAYISYLAVCLPGQEEATFNRLKQFIQASVPSFQLTTGQPHDPISPVALRQ
jgi:hypothetical protein